MRHLDLFSGIGGFALAASWVWGEDHEIVSFCEIESFPKKVLKKHWPDVPIHDDIKTMKGGNYGRIDLLTGGFPCQPYSVTGKRKGKNDDRALWPEMLRVIKEANPRWIIGENVIGFNNLELDKALSDLDSCGYEIKVLDIPACAVEAMHERRRIWIIANNEGELWETSAIQSKELGASPSTSYQKEDEFQFYHCGANHFIFQTEDKDIFCRKNDGIPPTMDKDRLKGLGNAIVPQVVVPIMQGIKEIAL